jgi:hypothetical protein
MDDMDEVRISTFSELIERLYADSWMAPLSRHRSNFAFRGMTDASHGLETNLHRLGRAPGTVELHLLRNFRKYAESDPARDDSVWSWLALAQHHGLPTRLLDFTYSPMVAMHFAVNDLSNFDVDGVIWCIDFVKTNNLLPEHLKAILAEEGSNAFTVEMLIRVADNLRDLDRSGHDPHVLFFEPPSLDQRIVNQFALFAMMSNPEARLDHWLRSRPDLGFRIIIPASLKWELRDKLDQANISERVLFPGLDGLTRWLKRYYTTRPR